MRLKFNSAVIDDLNTAAEEALRNVSDVAVDPATLLALLEHVFDLEEEVRELQNENEYLEGEAADLALALGDSNE